MTRIIFIDHSPKFSGAEKVLLNLLTLIKKSGAGITPVLVCPRDSDIVEYFRKEGVEIEASGMKWFTRKAGLLEMFAYAWSILRFSASLAGKIRKHDAAIVQPNTFISAIYAVIPAMLTRRPVVWYMYDILDVDLFNKLFVRFAAFGAKRIICASGAVRKRLEEFGVDGSKCVVIHNSILEQGGQDKPDTSGVRFSLGVPEGVPLVGIIGQITSWKGQAVFVEAVPAILREFPLARFVIVGDTMSPYDREYKESIERLIEKEGLGGKVILAGFRKDIPAVMGSLDVVVHASISPDALPTVILEAMFMGKPVVASNVGGVPEIIEDGRSGFIVPPADPLELSAAVSKLLRDRTLRERMGEQGRRTLLANFRAEDYLRKVFGVYSELLSEKKFQEKLTHG